MKKRNSSYKYVYRTICTLILLTLASITFLWNWWAFVSKNNSTGSLLGAGNLGMAVGVFMFVYLVIGRGLHAFKIGVERTANIIAAQVLTVFVTCFFEVFISMAITGNFRFFQKLVILYFPMALFLSVLQSVITVPMIRIYRYVFPPMLLLEIYGERKNHLYDKINGLVYKYRIEKSIRYQDADRVIQNEIGRFDAVVINDVPAWEENHILKICFDCGVRVYLAPKISDFIVRSSEELNLFDTPLFLCRNIGLTKSQLIVKRVLDIILSLIALIVASPIFLITAIAIKLEDRGPVFFRQERCTLNGKRFQILKFRSMIVDAEKDGRPHPAGEKDDRITRVGAVIRATRIDELPQIINILIGDMSIVGPRPERVEHVEKYTRDIPEFPLRLKVKGGLTGFAQVYGKYNTTALDKLKMDLDYILNYSLLLDVQIIFETVKILFQKESTEGFSEERTAEMHDAELHAN